MLRPTYPLRTARLALRLYSGDDFDELFEIYSRPDVVRYLYGEARTAAQVRALLDRKIGQSGLDDEGRFLALAVVYRDVGRVVGDVTLHWLSREHRQGELGYVFHPDHHGRGLATEAAEVVLRLAFAELGLHRVIGRCDARHTASARVLEKLGMRREAHFRHNEMFKGEWGDEFVYALLDEEWKDRR